MRIPVAECELADADRVADIAFDALTQIQSDCDGASTGPTNSQPEESVAAAPATDPDDWKLPVDVEINHIRFRKGVGLQTFVDAARRWHTMAAERTPEERARALDDASTREGEGE